jgi:hypothetical protein
LEVEKAIAEVDNRENRARMTLTVFMFENQGVELPQSSPQSMFYFASYWDT